MLMKLIGLSIFPIMQKTWFDRVVEGLFNDFEKLGGNNFVLV